MYLKSFALNLPHKKGSIVQAFRETFEGGDELFISQIRDNNGFILIKTQRDDLNYNRQRKTLLNSCQNCKPTIGYRNARSIRYAYDKNNRNDYKELYYDIDLYTEHKDIVAQKKSQLGIKYPKLFDLVLDRLKSDPVSQNWDLELSLVDVISSGEAKNDWQDINEGTMLVRDYNAKYEALVRQHMYALAILNSLPKPKYTELKPAGSLRTLDEEW